METMKQKAKRPKMLAKCKTTTALKLQPGAKLIFRTNLKELKLYKCLSIGKMLVNEVFLKCINVTKTKFQEQFPE